MLRRLLFAMVFISLATSACTKKRPEMVQQGQIKDLAEIRDYDGKSFQLQTHQQIERADNTQAEKLEIDSSLDTINNFGYVSYTTNAKLLQNDVPFRGKENSQYEVKYVIKPSENLLVVYKIGPKNLIPHDEYMYSVNGVTTSDKFAIPLVGYRILGFYRIEKARNSDNEETNLKVEIPERDFRKATHMRLDLLDRQAFEAIKMSDVYPANYFSGDWYYAQTVVGATQENLGNVGDTWRGFDTNLSIATRIRFQPSKSYLLGVNLNLDDRLRNDELNYAKVIQIPVEWMDRNVINHLNAKVLRPSERDVFWQEASKSLLKVKFAETVAVMDAWTGSFVDLKEQKKLMMLQFSKDYFSFTIYDAKNQERVKHAFQRVNDRGYKAKHYPEKDAEKFGYFNGIRNQVVNHQMHRREDIFKNKYLARFNPEKKEIVYHLTTSSQNDEWLNSIARQGVDAWDKAFQAAGTGIRVRLDEQKRVELGDIRYNSLNFINAIDGGSLGGLGPMLIDPFSGEIISSTSNIHVTTYLGGMTAGIRDYIRLKLGQLDDASKTLNLTPGGNTVAAVAQSSGNSGFAMRLPVLALGKDKRLNVFQIGAKSQETSEQNTLAWFNSDEGRRLRSKLEKLDNQGEIKTPEAFFERAQNMTALMQNAAYNPVHEIHNQSAIADVMTKDIEEQCPEVLDFVKQHQTLRTLPNTDQENVVAEPCAKRLARDPLVSVVVHEMGHNFGLMHNFNGTSDPSNFFNSTEIKNIYGLEIPEEKVSKSSSVMDYISSSQYDTLVPGKYDIAAIRYGYAEAVEKKDGSIVKLNPNESLEQVHSRVGGLRAYRFCDNVSVSLALDPMCQMHDYGATPTEVVDNMIKHYKDNFILSYYRFDRMSLAGSNARAAYNVNSIYLDLRRFYDQWRFLLRSTLPQGKEYLENISKEDYKTMLEKLSTMTGPHADSIKEYLSVREKIFNFLMDVAFTPNRYCVGVSQNNNLDFVELEYIRKILSQRIVNETVASCSSPAALNYLKSKGLQLVKEIGHPIEDTRFSLRDFDIVYPLDVAGYAWDRIAAMQLATMRLQTSVLNQRRNFFPNMTDEPDLREALENMLMTRVLYGADVTNLMKDVVDTSQGRVVIPKFAFEKDIIVEQFGSYKNSLFIPSSANASLARFNKFQAYEHRIGSQLEEFQPNVIQTASGFIAARQDWVASIAMMQKYEEIDAELAGIQFNVEAVKGVLSNIKDGLDADKSYSKVGEIKSIFDALIGILRLDDGKTLGQAEQQALVYIFGIERAILSQQLGPIQQKMAEMTKADANADTEDLKKEFEAALEIDATEFYTKNRMSPPSRAVIDERWNILVAEMEAKNNISDEQRSELDAQKEAILSVLRQQP